MFKDYKEMVLKPSWGFMTKHWKGLALIYGFVIGLSVGIQFIIVYWDKIIEIKNRIVNWFTRKFTKKEKES